MSVIDNLRKHSYIKDAFYYTVESSFSDKQKAIKLIEYIKKYMDKNSSVLLDSTLTHRLYFTDEDKDIVYKLSNIKEGDISKLVKEKKLTNTISKSFEREILWLFPLIIKTYRDNKNEVGMKNVIMYMSVLIYLLLHTKYFKFPPNENIMRYTITNLSNKYYIKKFGSLLECLIEITMNCHEKYNTDLDKLSDGDIVDYVNNLRIRLNNFVQEIAIEYYKNQESGAYLNLDEENLDDEENYVELTNISYNIETTSTSISNNIILGGLNEKLADLAANIAGVSRMSIKQTIKSIIKSKEDNPKIRVVVKNILTYYLVECKQSPESIASEFFINKCLEFYAKSNTTSKTVIETKDIIDFWLEKYSETYKKTQRAATLSAFKKGLFLYFVLCIQSSKTGSN